MSDGALEWTYFQTARADLFRSPALIWGRTDAILIDAAFTLSTGQRLVDEILAAGKALSRVFITCADPDYYFSLAPIRRAFPQARFLATEATCRAIRDTVEHKIAVWRSTLGDDGPKTLDDIVIPEVWPEQSLDLDGHAIEVLSAEQPNRFSLWVPSLSTLLGGVQIVSGIHVWMADTPTVDDRATWIASLDALLRKPLLDALPGHMTPGSDRGINAIRFTRQYILDFEDELARAADAATLTHAMKERYPNLAMEFVLELGAKVCKGEATWP